MDAPHLNASSIDSTHTEPGQQVVVQPAITRIERRGRGRPKKIGQAAKKKGIGKREYARQLSDESTFFFGKNVVSYRVFGMLKTIATHFASKSSDASSCQ